MEFRSSSPRSATNRAREFFLNNPDESLSYSDISVKFDITVDQAKNVVHELVRQGFAKVDHIVLVRARSEQ